MPVVGEKRVSLNYLTLEGEKKKGTNRVILVPRDNYGKEEK